MALKEPLWPRRLPPKLVRAAATLGPLGTRMPAPGTWGSAAGVLYALAFYRHAGWPATLLATLVVSFVAVALAGEAARLMGRSDPGEVILDEFVVMPLVFLGWRSGWLAGWPEWAVLAAGFVLFRFYDILKPLGIARLQRWPGGWGIVADDFAAALAACGTLHAMATALQWLR